MVKESTLYWKLIVSHSDWTEDLKLYLLFRAVLIVSIPFLFLSVATETNLDRAKDHSVESSIPYSNTHLDWSWSSQDVQSHVYKY